MSLSSHTVQAFFPNRKVWGHGAPAKNGPQGPLLPKNIQSGHNIPFPCDFRCGGTTRNTSHNAAEGTYA